MRMNRRPRRQKAQHRPSGLRQLLSCAFVAIFLIAAVGPLAIDTGPHRGSHPASDATATDTVAAAQDQGNAGKALIADHACHSCIGLALPPFVAAAGGLTPQPRAAVAPPERRSGVMPELIPPPPRLPG